jgi:hypothetical protein
VEKLLNLSVWSLCAFVAKLSPCFIRTHNFIVKRIDKSAHCRLITKTKLKRINIYFDTVSFYLHQYTTSQSRA